MKESNLFELSKGKNEIIRWLWRLKFPLATTIYLIKEMQTFNVFDEKMLFLQFASALIYITGRIADMKSTIKSMEIISQADKLGIEHDLFERNPHLPNKPTKAQILGKEKTMVDIGWLIPSIIFPPMGVILGGGSFLIAHINKRVSDTLAKKVLRRQNY